MIRVMGNSIERVRINDLNDTIYYRQKKEITDQDYDRSKDLQREVRAGRVIMLERVQPVRTDTSDIRSDIDRIVDAVAKVPQNSSINAGDLKRAVLEALSEHKSTDIQDTLLGVLPMLTEAIRQEVSKIQVVAGSGPVPAAMDKQTGAAAYTDAVYTPTINTDGMISNVKAEERTSDSGDVGDALAALRKLNGLRQ